VGVDWNGLHRGAQFGEFWTADGWDDSGRDADHVTVRKTVRHSLARVREFWRTHGIWPETTPQDEGLDIEYEGPSPADLEHAACTECGTNVWRTRPRPVRRRIRYWRNLWILQLRVLLQPPSPEQPGGDRRRSERLPPAGVTSRPVFVPQRGRGLHQESSEVIPVSQQQSPDNVSIDEIPVDIDTTQSAEVEPVDIPDEIESITRGLAGEQPPTNPLVVLKAARWWYIHGKGGTDPAFRWAIEWARHLATDTPSDVERFDEFLEYLVTVGFADEPHELR